MYYTGSAIVTEKSITASFDGMVEASFSLQGTGALSETTI
jgi:predicted secreted protein